MPRTIPRYGWRPSLPDFRDKIADPTGLPVLDEVDLRLGPMPQVFDQGQLGSCTANAVAAALQFDRSLDIAPKKARRRSRLDIYYGERQIEGSLGQGDVGAYGRDGFKFAQQTGCLLETLWGYNIASYEGPPPLGKRHKLTKPYAAVTRDITSFKQVLSNQQTIAFGFSVFDSFESQEVASTGIVPMPNPGERMLGGHEVLIVGYLADHPDHALVRNSWSSSWGLEGYCLFPWAYLMDTGLSGDFRTVVRAV